MVLQTLALLIAIIGTIVWIIGGARTGFYVVTEEIPKIEAVTEMEYSITQDKFLPGIDFLFGGLILGGSFYLASFLFPKTVHSKPVSRP